MRNLFWLALTAFLPLYAFGDYIPGRTRVSAEGSLATVSAQGRYAGVKGARAAQLKTDGKGYTHFTLQLDQAQPVDFLVTENRVNRCGQSFVATVKVNGQRSELRITEVSPEACRTGSDQVQWRTTLTTDEGPRQPPSRLVLRGPAEYYLLSQ